MKKNSLSFSKEQWGEITRIALTLVAIAAVVSIALAAVNEVCAPRIADQKEQAVKDAMAEVLPAENYSKVENLEGLYLDPIVTDAYKALNGDGVIGYCVKVAPTGFGGVIDMVVGINTSGEVERVYIVNMTETPGLGTKTKEASFLDRFNKLTSGFKLVSGSATEKNQVSAIAGATVSSKAVSTGVSAALTAVEFIKGADNNG